MKATLDRAYIYGGKYYGPGEVNVPKEMHASLVERGLLQAEEPQDESQERQAAARAEAQPEAQPSDEQALDMPFTPDEPPTPRRKGGK